MRGRGWSILLAASLAAAQDADLKEIKGAEGRLSITVPTVWTEMPPAGNVVLHARAPGSWGGHDLIVARETGQHDIDRQRDRYMEYDGGKYPGAEIAKVAEPFFGYRLNHAATDRVLVRAFKADGTDGLVLTVQSRFKRYDELYAPHINSIAASLKAGLGGPATPAAAPEEGDAERIYDLQARVSVVAPADWKSLRPEVDTELLVLGHKGSRSGPEIVLEDWGGPTNASLVILKISGEWNRSYANIALERVGTDPPALMALNRKEGWTDYLIAFDAGGTGYTLRLTAREGGFDQFRPVLDAMAKTVVFADGPYTDPTEVPGDVSKAHRKDFVVHARAERAGDIDAVIKVLPAFTKEWKRIGPGDARKAPPLHVLLVDSDRFAKESNGFGERPCAYDRARCIVVAEPPPEDKETAEFWRGRLFGALTKAALHRDLAVAAPPWLRAGLAACMDAAGRTGKGPDEANAALVDLLRGKTEGDTHVELGEVIGWTYADFERGDDAGKLAQAWGYTNLLLYGGGTLASLYKKWIRELEKSERGVPAFDLKGYERAREDLKNHVSRNWGKS